MSALLGGVLFVAVVFVVILFHEAGHYFAAKAFGIKVQEFFLGFGPRLWSTRRGETEYGIKALPFGGYVRIAGMNPFEETAPEDRERVFAAKPAWQRVIVLVAGAMSHFVLALVFLVVFFVSVGLPVLSQPTVTSVEDRLDGAVSPAIQAGLRAGDQILEVDGQPVEDSDQLVELTRSNVGQEVELLVERDGERLTVRATPVLSEVEGEEVGRLGVVLSQEIVGRERFGPLTAVGRAATTTGDMIVRSGQALGELFSPAGLGRIGRLLAGQAERGENDPVSVVGAARLSGQAASVGAFDVLLFLFAGFNVFVGLLNLLPLPPLDGGHVAVLLWEKATGRRVDVRKLIPVTALVAGFLILFMVSVIYLDVVRPIPNPFE